MQILFGKTLTKALGSALWDVTKSMGEGALETITNFLVTPLNAEENSSNSLPMTTEETTPAISNEGRKKIKVKDGDTLSEIAQDIAKKLGDDVSIADVEKWLKANNNIENIHQIRAGEELQLPMSKSELSTTQNVNISEKFENYTKFGLMNNNTIFHNSNNNKINDELRIEDDNNISSFPLMQIPALNTTLNINFENNNQNNEVISMYTQAISSNHDVIYYGDNIIERRSGGTRAWRNNNPGNIRSGHFANRRGSIGPAGGFAVFPSYESGRTALSNLLLSESYQSNTLYNAIERYAPPNENNTRNYQRFVQGITEISSNTYLSNLNNQQFNSFIDGIQRIEGYRIGNVNFLSNNN